MKNHLWPKSLLVFSILIVLAQLLSSCAPATPEETVVLRLGTLGFPDSRNPAAATLGDSYSIFDLVYTPLLREGTNGRYVGELARSWEVSADGRVWTFHLNNNVKWHDGTRFTAQDMVSSIQAVIDNPDGWASFSAYVAGFSQVTAPDNTTLEITLDSPVGNMEYRVSFLYALYPAHFGPLTNTDALLAFENVEMIGTGPFKLKLFDPTTGLITLEANRDFYGQQPKIDEVIFQTFDDVDAMMGMLQDGSLDAVLDLPQNLYSLVQTFDDIQTVRQPGRYFTDLIINSTPFDHIPAPNYNPALADPQVRLAIAQSIDKQALVDIVLEGLGTPGLTIIPATLGGGFWQNTNIQDVVYDPDAAMQTLEAAGYTPESDGIRGKDGLRLEFRLQYPDSDPNYARVADLISIWLQAVGMKANIEMVDSDTLMTAMTPTGDFDLVIWGWGPDPDPDFILSVLTSDQFVDGGWSDSGYMNPIYDQLYIEQQTTFDQNKRQQIIWQMQEIIFNDRPYLVLWYEDTLQAYRNDTFQNYIQSPLGIESVFSLTQVEPVK
ncbi:MAG TPA: ABC transporter substrate-binding protein [Anaerolineales bacterium]|nr:ABC transporter substrate-binding protein [Anaerolineales bacterium]